MAQSQTLVRTFIVFLLAAMNIAAVEPINAQQKPTSRAIAGQRAEQLVTDGAAALERGDSEAARILFRRALKVDPRSISARTYLGLIADHAGQLAEAEQEFRIVAAQVPNSPEARNNYGAILLRLGRKPAAAREFEASLRLNPKQAGALVNLARIHFESGQVAELRTARDLFDRAWTISPDAETARARVVVSLRLGDGGAATSAYRDYLSALSNAPAGVTGPPLRAELGTALLEAGLYREAASELQVAVDANPSESNSVVSLAKAYRGSNDLALARRTLEAALARGLQGASLYAELAEVYEREGRAENAIPAMRMATELDPNNELYRFRYTMLLTDTSAPQAAILRLQEALKVFPDSAPLWFAMGIAQFQANHNEDAIHAFQHALQLNSRIWGALAYLGMIEVDRGQAAQAVEFYRRALEIEDRSPVTLFLIAEAYSRLTPADDSQAERQLNRALQLDPGFVQARLALGKLYSRQNRLPEAAAELEQVVKADPALAEAYYQLGRVYVRQKRQKEGSETLAKFQQLSDDQKKQSEDARRDIVRRLADVRF